MIPVNDPPEISIKPMLNTPCEAEITAEKWLQRVLTRLQQSRESRELAMETAHVQNIPNLLDRLLERLQKIKQ
jgi:hypothetical protein